MSKPLAILWGLLTILPIALVAWFMATFFRDMTPLPGNPEASRQEFDTTFAVVMTSNGLIFVLLISYIVYLFKTSHVPKDKKALWAVVLFLGHMISMPIFWFLYVWSPLQNSRYPENDAT